MQPLGDASVQYKQPVIILCYPQLPENIGMVARAMLNFGLTELRLVAPRDGWPPKDIQTNRAWAAASGADHVLNYAQAYPDLLSAVSDLNIVYGTTPRHHDMVKTTRLLRPAMQKIQQELGGGQRVGILFGPERTGLVNEDISRCDELVLIPTNPDFYSLNLAQAVNVCAYEYWIAATGEQGQRQALQLGELQDEMTHFGKTRPASRLELNAFLERLEITLDGKGFYASPEMKPVMQQNLRAAFTRQMLTEQEIRTLHGVVTALMKPESA